MPSYLGRPRQSYEDEGPLGRPDDPESGRRERVESRDKMGPVGGDAVGRVGRLRQGLW